MAKKKQGYTLYKVVAWATIAMATIALLGELSEPTGDMTYLMIGLGVYVWQSIIILKLTK